MLTYQEFQDHVATLPGDWLVQPDKSDTITFTDTPVFMPFYCAYNYEKGLILYYKTKKDNCTPEWELSTIDRNSDDLSELIKYMK